MSSIVRRATLSLLLFAMPSVGPFAAQSRLNVNRPRFSIAASSHYRVLISGFAVNQETRDDPKQADGKRDEIFLASQAIVLSRSTGQMIAKQAAVSSEYGDVSGISGRLFAGTATTMGGLQTGDRLPSPDPSLPNAAPSTTTLPLVIFDGTLTDGADEVLLLPSIWETDRVGNAFDIWTIVASSLRPFGTPKPGFLFPTFDASSDIRFSSPEPRFPWDDPIAATRPIGIRGVSTDGNSATWSFRPVIVRLRREDLEPYFVGSNITAPNGSHGVAFALTFAETDKAANGNYVMWLWVEKLP
jgi:hypothetical protein